MMTFTTLLAGNGITLFSGCSKTGLPGASILGVVLLANLLPETRQSVGVLLPLLIAADLFAVAYYRRHADWRILLRLMPWTVAGLGLGYLTLRHAREMNFNLVLGGLVLLMLGLDALRVRLGWDRMPHHPVYAALLGIASGFSTTIGNLAGPLMSLYLVSLGLDKHRFMGSMAWFFLLVNLLKVPLFVLTDLITPETLELSLRFLPGLLLGALAGRWLFRHIPQGPFQLAVRLLAAAAALRLMSGG